MPVPSRDRSGTQVLAPALRGCRDQIEPDGPMRSQASTVNFSQGQPGAREAGSFTCPSAPPAPFDSWIAGPPAPPVFYQVGKRRKNRRTWFPPHRLRDKEKKKKQGKLTTKLLYLCHVAISHMYLPITLSSSSSSIKKINQSQAHVAPTAGRLTTTADRGRNSFDVLACLSISMYTIVVATDLQNHMRWSFK